MLFFQCIDGHCRGFINKYETLRWLFFLCVLLLCFWMLRILCLEMNTNSVQRIQVAHCCLWFVEFLDIHLFYAWLVTSPKLRAAVQYHAFTCTFFDWESQTLTEIYSMWFSALWLHSWKEVYYKQAKCTGLQSEILIKLHWMIPVSNINSFDVW